VRVGQLAVDTGLVVLFEIENGTFRLTSRSRSIARRNKRKPIFDFVATQARFNGISEQELATLQTFVDRRWDEFLRRDASGSAPGD
jgi:pyruvate ferredoxin oxidoreductase beta subunit